MTTRLNESLRLHIIKAIKAKSFRPRQAALNAELTILANDIYEHVYAQTMLRMARLPEGWLRQTTDLKCQFNGQCCTLTLSRVRRFPDSHADRYSASAPFRFPSSSPFTARWQQIQAEDKKNDEAEYEALQHVKGLLKSCRTVEALLKTWPEVKPFLPTDLSKPEVTALAIPIASLNAMLGLKP